MEDENVISNDWPAPAKLNLFLHIIGRRDDGYHLLQTVFQFIDLCDHLDFRVTDGSDLALKANYPVQNPADDLIIRAADLLQRVTGCNRGAEITARKNVPMGAGLGGGSSNAATTLVALNHLWQLDLPADQLLQIGVKLGADVPVFIHGHAAWAEGVGEVVTTVEPVEDWKLVIYPGCHVPTAEIFNAGDLTRNTAAITIRDFLKAGGHNDCEATAKRRYPEIAAALDWLNQYAGAKMTGTGSSVFASFSNRDQAEAAVRQIPAKWQGFVTRAMNRSPLVHKLARETGER